MNKYFFTALTKLYIIEVFYCITAGLRIFDRIIFYWIRGNMKLKQMNFIKLIFAFALFLYGSNALPSTEKTAVRDYQVEVIPGKSLAGSKNLNNGQLSEYKNNSEETGQRASAFNTFNLEPLKSAPDNESIVIRSALEKMSGGKKMSKGSISGQVKPVTKDIATDLNRQKLVIGNTATRGEKNNDIEKKGITFNFPNVSLQEFVRFVANLNKKILIGANLLQGNVTLKTPKELSLEELMEVFEALLNSHGLDYMMTEDSMQIFQKASSDIKVYKINYLKSVDIAKSLSDIFKMSFNVGGVPQRIMIESLDQANAVVVLAPKEKHVEIAKAIKDLDWRRRQVLLEIRIVELTYNEKFGFGVTGGTSGSKNPAYGIGKDITKASVSPAPALGTAGTSAPYSGVVWDNGHYFANLEANKDVTELKILSQPKLLTAENQKAEIKIGKKQPIVSSSMNIGTEGNTGLPVTNTSVDWKDIGIDINVTPRVNSNRDVSLDFNLKLTAILRSEKVMGTEEYPIIGHRIAQNSSTVMDNEMLVIGGLLKNEKNIVKVKVPFFGEVPGMGWLFTTTSEETEQTELLIFIKPRVIENRKEGYRVTKIVTKKFEDYDPSRTKQLKKMVKGERDHSWNVFNIYQYFNSGEYRGEQDVVPQEWGSFHD